MLAALTALEGVTFWNLMYPPPPPRSSEHPFPAATYLVHVVNVTSQTDGVSVSIRWNGWNDTWVWLDEGSKMLLNRDDRFQLLLKPKVHAQIDFYAYSYVKQENYTISVNVYRDGSKNLGPWSYTE